MNLNNYVKLKKYNTFNLDAKAKEICLAYSIKEMLKIWKKAQLKKLPILLLGSGSNVLFIKNFKGIVIINKIKDLKIKQSKKEWFIHVGSGNNWHNLIKKLIKNKIYGLENLALIPGTAGAAPIQNIGAYGMEFKDVCHYVDIIDLRNGKQYRLDKKSCKFNYRDSIFKHKFQKFFAIISIGIRLKKNWKPKLRYFNLNFFKKKITKPIEIFKFICKIRRRTIPNPNLIGNAGSFFKNPIISTKIANKIKKNYPKCKILFEKNKQTKISAGWLIKKFNLDELQFGGASVYKNKPIILINKNNAIGNDIVNLAKLIYKKIIKKFQIKLEPEVNFIGEYNKIQQSKKIFYEK